MNGVRAVYGMGHTLVLLEKDEGWYYCDAAVLTSTPSQTNTLYQTWLPIPTGKILAGDETAPLGGRVKSRRQYQYVVCCSCLFVHLWKKRSCNVLCVTTVTFSTIIIITVFVNENSFSSSSLSMGNLWSHQGSATYKKYISFNEICFRETRWNSNILFSISLYQLIKVPIQ